MHTFLRRFDGRLGDDSSRGAGLESLRGSRRDFCWRFADGGMVATGRRVLVEGTDGSLAALGAPGSRGGPRISDYGAKGQEVQRPISDREGSSARLRARCEVSERAKSCVRPQVRVEAQVANRVTCASLN